MTREAFQCKQMLDTRDAGGPQVATIAEGVSGRCAAPAGVAQPRAAEEPRQSPQRQRPRPESSTQPRRAGARAAQRGVPPGAGTRGGQKVPPTEDRQWPPARASPCNWLATWT